MKILCTDLEGTLAPEIWQELGEHLNIPELNLTTRDIPNFEDLMKQRMKTLKTNEIKFSEIKKFLASIEPFEGAKNFLSALKNKYQVSEAKLLKKSQKLPVDLVYQALNGPYNRCKILMRLKN